jgi:hypothetical protein
MLKGYFRMKDRSRSVYDLGLLIVIVSAVAFATITVYSQNQTQAPAAGAAPAQSPRPTPSPSPTPTPINWSTDPLLKRFVWRSIGPASMGGRIDDIAAVEQNPYIIYVGFATNGVWKSTNNGTTFQPIFDTYGTHSIGDIALRLRIQTSSGSALVKPTIARARASATASTSRPTPARLSRRWASKIRRRSRAS